jgi:hypothetical protein
MIYTWSSFANFSALPWKEAVGVHQMDVGVPRSVVPYAPTDSRWGCKNLYIWNRSVKVGLDVEIVVGIEHANSDEFL